MSKSILDFQLSNMILPEFEQKMSTPNRAKNFHLILLIIFALTNNVLAGYGFKLDGTLDKEEISRSYFEGEFSKVLPPLETYRANFPSNATKDDSIFVYKYLSVIYASDPKTKQKAESYMVQMIKMKPTIEIMDMYISDNIESIFKNVKQNLLVQQKYMKEHDFVGNEKKDSVEIRTEKHSSRKWIWWTCGGIGVVTLATTSYFLFQNSSSDGPKPITLKP